MIREIRTYPNPILKKKAEEIKEINEEVKKLSRDMIETMKANQGIGLAGPQIGESKRIIIVQTEQGPVCFINPEIVKKSKETEVVEEGCLSVPGVFLKIKRAKEVEVSALNLQGKKVYIKAKGLVAIIFQQEIDHLNGILIIDKISRFQRWRIRNKLKELEKSV